MNMTTEFATKQDKNKELFKRLFDQQQHELGGITDENAKNLFVVLDDIVISMNRLELGENNAFGIQPMINPNEDLYFEKTDGNQILIKFDSAKEFIVEMDDVFLMRHYRNYYDALSLDEIHSAFTHILRATVGRELAKTFMSRSRFTPGDDEYLQERYDNKSFRSYRYKIPKTFFEIYINKRKDLGVGSTDELQYVVLP